MIIFGCKVTKILPNLQEIREKFSHLVPPAPEALAEERTISKAAGCGQRCQKCCERGYYYLHQRLDDFTLVHSF